MKKYDPKKKEDIIEAIELLQEGAVIMVKPYADDYKNFTGVSLEDFEGDTEEEIIDYFSEKKAIEFWDEMYNK